MFREFESRIDSEGHFEIPRDLRNKKGLKEGTRVKIEEHADGLLVAPIQSPRPIRSMKDMAGFLGTEGKALETLMEERAKDREKEDRPFRL